MSDREDGTQPQRDQDTTLKDKAASLKEAAGTIAEQQKNTGAAQLSGIAGAVHAAADELGRSVPGAADYIHDAAARIDDAATSLRERSLPELADGVRRLGRERPLMLFGGAVLAGFALSRFLKSAADLQSRGQTWKEARHGERV